MNLLRVRRAGVLSRHRHPAPVHGYVIKSSWRYLEHVWVAREGIIEALGDLGLLEIGFACVVMTSSVSPTTLAHLT